MDGRNIWKWWAESESEIKSNQIPNKRAVATWFGSAVLLLPHSLCWVSSGVGAHDACAVCMMDEWLLVVPRQRCGVFSSWAPRPLPQDHSFRTERAEQMPSLWRGGEVRVIGPHTGGVEPECSADSANLPRRYISMPSKHEQRLRKRLCKHGTHILILWRCLCLGAVQLM